MKPTKSQNSQEKLSSENSKSSPLEEQIEKEYGSFGRIRKILLPVMDRDEELRLYAAQNVSHK